MYIYTNMAMVASAPVEEKDTQPTKRDDQAVVITQQVRQSRRNRKTKPLLGDITR